MSRVPVAVGIPTWGRSNRVATTIDRIQKCDPQPSEIIVYVDGDDVSLAREINSSFAEVRVLGGRERIGPGGSRHQCIAACGQPIFASFDDDSFPVDCDFFARIAELFATHPDAAVLGATIWHRHETERARDATFVRKADFTGCGHALRVSAYRQTRGYLSLQIAYGMEETDLAIQLFARGWRIFQCGELRVFHDTELGHHESSEITANSIANVALFAFLHYPVRGSLRAFLQVANKTVDSLRRGRSAGILKGLLRAPGICWSFRRYRTPLEWSVVRRFFELRTTKVVQ